MHTHRKQFPGWPRVRPTAQTKSPKPKPPKPKLSSTEPPSTESPSTQPPSTEPPVVKQPVIEPPSMTEPPPSSPDDALLLAVPTNLSAELLERERSGRFVGRQSVLANLHQQFQTHPNRAVAIAGISGIGKTELALQYIRQYHGDYPGGICWIGDRSSDVFTPLIEFAQHQLGMMGPQENRQANRSSVVTEPPSATAALSLAETAAYYLTNWQQTGAVLLVLDDVVSTAAYQTLIEALPSQFRCLLTVQLSYQSSRRPSNWTSNRSLNQPSNRPSGSRHNDVLNHWPAEKRPLELQELSILGREESLQLLGKFVGARVMTAQPAAKSLCKKVGYLPTAVCLLGKYFATHPSLSVGEVSQALTRQSQTLLLSSLPSTHIATVNEALTELNKPELALAEKGIWAAFELCWQQLESNARRLCQLLSFCIPGEIPWELVDEIARCTELTGSELITAKTQLQSLLPNSTATTLRLHPLSHTFIAAKRLQHSAHRLSGQSQSAQERWHSAYANGLANFAATIRTDLTPQEITQIAPAIGQIKAALSPQTIEEIPDECVEPLFSGISRFYSALAVFPEAVDWAHRAHEVLCDRLGEDHPQTAKSLNNLANVYTVQNRFDEAEAIYRQALARAKQRLGTNHPDIAKGLNNLANVYSGQQRFSEAEALYLETIEISKRHLKKDPLSVATSLNNLALLYANQGKFSEAETLYLESLEITQRSLGDTHLAVAKGCNSLANVYASQGNFEQAEHYYLQDLEITKENLGEAHLDVGTSLNNLALLYKGQGRFGDAEPLYKQALSITQQTLGDHHPAIAKNLNNLANVYSGQGRFSEAEPLYQKALYITQRNLGEAHPDVATSLNNLALLYKTQGRFDEAEPLYVHALEIAEHSFSDHPPVIAASLNNLANVYIKQQRFEQAEPLYKKALQITEQQLDQSPLEVATSLNNLAHLYKIQGRYDEAEALCLQSLDMNQNTLGGDHPAVAKSLNNLAFLYKEQGRYGEAEALFLRALTITKKTLADDHPEILTRTNNLEDLRRSRKRRRVLRSFRFILLGLLTGLCLYALFGFSQDLSASGFARLVFIIFLALTVWFLQAIFVK